MATKRTTIVGRNRLVRITPKIVELYRRLKRIHDEGDSWVWANAYEQRLALDKMLDRRSPWLNDIFDVDGECPYPQNTQGHTDWPDALAIRQALDAAIEEKA